MKSAASALRSALALAAAGAILLAGCRADTAPEVARLDAQKAAVVRFWETFNAATALRMKGDCGAASVAYRRALEFDPRHEDSLYYLGQCLREQGSFREARDEFTRLVGISPSSARGHLALGALLASPDPAAPLDLEAAESHLRRAHEINGEETGPIVRLGEILIVKGDPAQARQWLEGAARTNAKSVDAAFLSGYLRWQEGDLEGAGAFYAKALRAAETDAPVKGVLGEGDRKAAPGTGGAPPAGAPPSAAAPGAAEGGPAHIAAPPLKSPLGRTLFGEFTAQIRAGAAHPLREPFSENDLRGVYAPVQRLVREIAGRASPGTSVAISPGAAAAPAGFAPGASSRQEGR
jgi:tetratricopeptide (TPR) repeat protein